MTDEFRHYRRWFYAAAIYNAAWGSAVVLFPGTLLRMVGMNAIEAVPLVQVTEALLRLHLDRPCRQDPWPPGIYPQRVDRFAALELRLGLRVQRPHLVASLLALRAQVRARLG